MRGPPFCKISSIRKFYGEGRGRGKGGFKILQTGFVNLIPCKNSNPISSQIGRVGCAEEPVSCAFATDRWPSIS